jgi:prefoldin subunit 5
VLHLGRVPALEGKLEKLEEIAEELRGRFEKVEMELSHLSGGMKLTPTQAERQTELMFEQTTYQGQLAKCEASIGTLNEKIQAISTVHLTVSKYLYHRAVLVIGGGRYEVRDDVKGPVTVLRQRDGELVYRVGDNGSNRPLKQISEFRLAA